MPDKYAVMGHPIGHSKSPQIHQQFAEQCGLDIEYTAIDVAPGTFADAVKDFQQQGGKGLNVTVPYKLEAWQLVDRRSKRAELAGAVNTIKFNHNKTLFGENTDGIGLVRDITQNLNTPLKDKSILLLGAGGAVRGILGPILEQQPKLLHIANRTVSKAEELKTVFAELGSITASGFDDIKQTFDIVINGTAASLQGELPPLPDTLFNDNALAYDLMYAKEPTAFMT
ncbi:MAG: shikimate dehydrogenase, partial [Gammaproteobacteria bacterium]|nr:shikimate dehydrogenase [Gammaproteobacteria bacterium]